MINKSQSLNSAEVELLLNKIFHEKEIEQILKDWTARVLDSCNPEYTLNFYQLSLDVDTRKETEFQIRLNKSLSNSEILILLIISYYLPHEGGFILREGISNSERKRHLHKDIIYRLYSSGHSTFLLYLGNSNAQWRSLHGQIIKMIRRLEKDLTTKSDAIKPSSIFHPFWSPPQYDFIERYSGYTKHFKDHGTLASDSHGSNNHSHDREWLELYTASIERKRKEFEDSLGFILGLIQ